MWAWVDRAGLVVSGAAASAVVLLLVAVTAMIACRQPARRVRMARATTLGLLALVPLEFATFLPRFELRALAAWPDLRPPTSQPTDPPALSAATFPDARASRALTLLYLGGVGGALGWIGLGQLGALWLTRRSTGPSGDALALYGSLTTPGTHPPRLRVSGRVRGPVLVGAPWRVILVPPSLDPLEPSAGSRERLRLALLHELAHDDARDPHYSLLARLTQAVWFFLPPLWWVTSQMRLDQEFLADRHAARRFGTLGSYASSLLGFATATGPVPAEDPERAPGARPRADDGHGSSALVQRVLMLLRCPFPVEPEPPFWWTFALACLTVAVTLGASTVSLRPVTQPLSLEPTGPRPSFQMAGLEVPGRAAGSHGYVPAFELPVRLPETFYLTLEVWGEPADVARVRVVGLPLSVPGMPQTPLVPPSWHRVVINRTTDRVSLDVDGSPVPLPLELSHLTTWLSLEPAPGCDGRFRLLHLSW